MNRTKQRDPRIEIRTNGEKIMLGEKYAIAAFIGSTVTWECPGHKFAVQFEPGTRFNLIEGNGFVTMTIPDDIKQFHPYKYTIAVGLNNKILILDPVLIGVPPEN